MTKTLNLHVLRSLPIYKLPPTYRLGDPGMGCAGDPPGYPTYYMRPVYTKYGNNPPRGPESVIKDGETLRVIQPQWKNETWEYRRASLKKLLDKLYVPLPFDHPRVQAWVKERYSQCRHCYIDPFKDPAIQLNIAELNITTNLRGETFPDWMISIELHRATIDVREFYPDFDPDESYADKMGLGPHDGNWWTTEETQPMPDKCKGQYGTPHPVNGTWCQWCGWHMTPEEEAQYRLDHETPEQKAKRARNEKYRAKWNAINKLPFEEKYDAIIKEMGGLLEFGEKRLSSYILTRAKVALEEGDEHLNTIQLYLWDKLAGCQGFSNQKFTLDQTQGWPRHLSLAERVCTLKRAAKRIMRSK